MDAKTFARACREQRDLMLAAYADPDSGTDVACLIAEASLSPEQTRQVLAALHSGLTDAFYTMLLALDGEVPLGSHQHVYTVHDDAGNIVASGDGRLESAASDALYSA